ncbi:MAG: enoyl-CoA hydratase/isomerase family protein [Acidobacteriota bacterium]|nr:MAG: enoyl-CoA hydratase/isomerase family protein [Acidobacteriota bacterium]
MFETVKYEINENVATIILNRPEALNALSRQITADLTSAIEKAIEDGARAVIVTGEGRAFCAGGDLREMKVLWESEGRIEAFLEDPLAALHGLITLIRETPVPFIAAVNGVCAGAGSNIALACDLVIASESASFNQAFIKIGLSPDCGGSFFLPRAVGEKRAAELLMTGDTISASDALSMGMINRAVPDEMLMQETSVLAAKLAAAPTAVIGRIKKMLNASSSNDLDAQLRIEHEMQLESGRGGDFKEGVAAFLEKRPPQFRGD